MLQIVQGRCVGAIWGGARMIRASLCQPVFALLNKRALAALRDQIGISLWRDAPLDHRFGKVDPHAARNRASQPEMLGGVSHVENESHLTSFLMRIVVAVLRGGHNLRSLLAQLAMFHWL